MSASMNVRTRARTPVSSGSVQPSKSREQHSLVECKSSGFVVTLVMAWSPARPSSRVIRGWHPETTPLAIPTNPLTAPFRSGYPQEKKAELLAWGAPEASREHMAADPAEVSRSQHDDEFHTDIIDIH